MAWCVKSSLFKLRIRCEKYFDKNRRYSNIPNWDCDSDVREAWFGRAQSERYEIETPLWRSVSCDNFVRHENDGSASIRPSVHRNKGNYVYLPTFTKPTFRTDDCYDGVKHPYVLIMNNVNFHTMPASRGGAVADVENLMEFFKDSGFTSINDHYDLCQDQMLQHLEETRKNPDLVDHDAFICVIMTHGDEQGLKGVDDWKPSIEVEKITSLFVGDMCPQLMTKPKLFFIQACRGDRADQGYIVPRGEGDALVTDADEKEMPVKLPSEADMLVAYSTTKHYVSFRKFTDNAQAMVEQRQKMGSWFISCMVQVFQQNSHADDLMTMLAKVNRAMTELYTGGYPGSGNKQISCQLSMLTKRIYFAKYWEQQKHIF